MFIGDIGLYFYFLMVSLSGFGIRVILASWNVFGCVSSSCIFLGKSLRRIDVSFKKMFGRHFL